MGKAWYNFFVVTEGAVDSPAPAQAVPPDATPRRVVDVVASPAADPAFVAPATPPTALDDIYRAAQIAVPAHGYTVLKVAEMLQNEHIRALPADVKRKSILVALDAAGVSVNEIVEDAVRRDRALDTYERVLEKTLEELGAQKQAENARLEQEIAQRLAELRARIEANNQDLARETAGLRAWQSRKRDEERRIADAVGYFVSENPVTAAAAPAGDPSATDKGGATHVR